jgi:hypothetical protein
MLDAADLGQATAAHQGDVEAALTTYEEITLTRAETEAIARPSSSSSARPRPTPSLTSSTAARSRKPSDQHLENCIVLDATLIAPVDDRL